MMIKHLMKKVLLLVMVLLLVWTGIPSGGLSVGATGSDLTEGEGENSHINNTDEELEQVSNEEEWIDIDNNEEIADYSLAESVQPEVNESGDKDLKEDVQQQSLPTQDISSQIEATNNQVAFAIGNGTENNPYVIMSEEELYEVSENQWSYLTKYFKLGADIDFTNWDWDEKPWEPIGSNSYPFVGEFDGNGYVIRSLEVDTPDKDYVGMFGRIGLTKITNINLKNISITGNNYVGGLVGYTGASIHSSSVVGDVSGNDSVGGLIGYNNRKVINSSYANVNVQANGNAVGGLVGENLSGGTTNSSASGLVKGNSYIGGLVGRASGYTKQSYSTVNVEGISYLGGLVGATGSSGWVKNSYATGDVTGSDDWKVGGQVGGLIGQNDASVKNTFATGDVTGAFDTSTGGLIGDNKKSLEYSYWDSFVIEEGVGTNSKGTIKNSLGVTEDVMKQRRTYENWNFNETWYQYENQTTPFLQWQNPLETVDVSIGNDKLYVGEDASINVTAIHEDGTEYKGSHYAMYTLNPKEIVKVENGKVIAQKAGKAVITARLGAKEGSVDVHVYPEPPEVDADSVPKYINTESVLISGKAEPEDIINITGGTETVSERVDNTTGEFAIDVPLNKNIENILEVKAETDGVESTPIKITVLHDDIAPTSPEIQVDPAGWVNADSVTVTMSYRDDEGSGVERTQYQLKGTEGDWTKYDNEEPPTVSDEGETSIYARTIDKAGNESEIAQEIVKIDRTPPKLELNGKKDIQVELGGQYNELGATAKDDYDENVNEKINTIGEVNVDKVGTYKVDYKVKDHARNPSILTRTVKVEDTTPPTDVTLKVTEKTNDSVTLELSAFDLSGIKSYILARDGKDFMTIDGHQSTFTDEGLESGKTYTYTVVAIDENDNKSEEINLTVTADLFIVDITEISKITVDYGTEQNDIPLPDEVIATLSDGTEVSVPVSWDDGKPVYDGYIVQGYEFTGEIKFQENVTNANNLAAVIEVTVEAPSTMELVLDDSPKPVYAGAFITIGGSNAMIQLPAGLPEGTMLHVESAVDISFGDLVLAGEIYNFVFTYPEGKEHYKGDFVLTLRADSENAAVYHYNEQKEVWEYVGGEVEDGLITVTVKHFSTYGVFTKKENETEKPPTEPGDEDNENDNGNGKKEQDGNDGQDGKTGQDGKDDTKGEGGESLPKTATNYYNWLFFGLVSILLAVVILQVNWRRKRMI